MGELNIDKIALLKQYFGHSGFRPGQEELIDALLSGRDVFGVMPTGAGKSVCYQLTALLLPGLTLVISPLISLMKDQVASLAQAGIPAAYINSTLDAEQYRQVYRGARGGQYKIIYVAPERLAAGDFQSFALGADISLLAVDEAHCVSQWGQDFRPSYMKIAEFADSLSQRPTVGAFTATATEEVGEDIVKLLRLRDPLRVTTGFDRPNLYFDVERPDDKDEFLRKFVAKRAGQSGIIYCSTRRSADEVCEKLRRRGTPVTKYHAGLDDDERRRNQEDFVYDRARVMVATNAFGMGIDKSNVGYVVHYNMPKNMESYYQEAGRAGRDGGKADCVLLYSPGDVRTAEYLIKNSSDSDALVPDEREQLQELNMRRLRQMESYCRTTGCLRKKLLEYFGESADDCGNCGNCNSELVRRDITVEAQKILSAVARIERKYTNSVGLTLVVKHLRGSREQRIAKLDLDKLPTYGIMSDSKEEHIRAYVDYLVDEGYLYQTDGDYPTLRLTPRAKDVLFDDERVEYAHRIRAAHGKAGGKSARGGKESRSAAKTAGLQTSEPPQTAHVEPDESDGELLSALKALRLKLAQQQNVPAYVVFSNVTLESMAAKRPQNMEEFLRVPGVGEIKAGRYGEQFLSLLRKKPQENAFS